MVKINETFLRTLGDRGASQPGYSLADALVQSQSILALAVCSAVHCERRTVTLPIGEAALLVQHLSAALEFIDDR